jgi:glycosyltransferase involved in cell wall biosynthesis
MKVLFLSWAFPPYHQSGSFRAEAFVKYLPEFGVEPIVVAGGRPEHSHHYAADTPEAGNGNGTQAVGRSVVEQVSAWKSDYTPDKDSAFGRTNVRLPFVGEMAAHRHRSRSVRAVVERAVQLAEKYKPTAIYATSPPESAILAAHQLGRTLNLPVVYDLRDPWSYRPIRPYYHVVSFWREKHLERSILSNAAMVIANTETARRLLTSELGVPPGKIQVIPNGYDDSHFPATAPTSEYVPGTFVVAYTGAFSPFRSSKRRSFGAVARRTLGFDFSPVSSDGNTRSPFFFLKAVENLLDHHPEIRKKFRVVFAGSHGERDRALFRAFRYPDVLDLVPPMSKHEAADLCRRVQLLLLLQLEVTMAGRDCCAQVPAKVFDYLRAGTRILGALQPGETRQIIERYAAGVVTGPRDVEGIEAALLAEFTEWTRREGKPAPSAPRQLEEYSRAALTGKLAKALHEVDKSHACSGVQ